MGIRNAMSRAVDGLLHLQRRFFHFNFYRCHLAFFIVTILISSVTMYASTASPSASQDPNSPDYGISYIDAFFMCASAVTNTGLTSLDLSLLTGYQQSILFVLMWIGDLSTISISVVFVRRWFFQKRMSELACSSKTVQRILNDVDCEKAERQATRTSNQSSPSTNSGAAQSNSDGERGRQPLEKSILATGQGSKRRESSREVKFRMQQRSYASHERHYGGLSAPWETAWLKKSFSRVFRWSSNSSSPSYLSFQPRFDDRGRFRRLTSEQYAELGGAEYRALQCLSWILPLYAAIWVFLTMCIITPYAAHYGPVADTIQTSQPGNTSPVWFGVFVSLSAYTNGGLTLLNASMIPFQGNYIILIVTGAAVIAGNTFYPIFLRFFIWLIQKVVPKESDLHHSLAFLLQHPRRCYLFLFDRKTTWILTAVQLVVILGEWVLFEITNINQTAIAGLAPNLRVLDGLYQSLSTRASGFYIVTISSIAPAMQIVYIVTMYMSAFPILISVRQTNVYEERSIGLDVDEYEAHPRKSHSSNAKKRDKKGKDNGEDKDKDKDQGDEQPTRRFTTQHIRNQLAYDLWWIILSWFLIAIIEEPSLNDAAPGYSIFSVLFEVVSGYGNCGLSLGVPYDDYSLVGTFHVLSKLIMVSVMLRGRHRILPMAIDRSILLPGQGLMEEMDREYNPLLHDEEKMQEIRRAESGRNAVGRPQPEGGEQDPEPTEEREEAVWKEQGEDEGEHKEGDGEK